MNIYLFLANDVVYVSEAAIISQFYRIILRNLTEPYPLQEALDETCKTQRPRSFVTKKMSSIINNWKLHIQGIQKENSVHLDL